MSTADPSTGTAGGDTASADPLAALSRGMEAGGEAVAQALSRLFRSVPCSVEVTRQPEGLALAGTAAHRVGVGFDVTGEARARLMLLAETEAASRLASSLLRRPEPAAGPLDTDAREALAELGNILASSFLNGLARRAKLVLLPSIPTFAEDTAAQFAALRLHRDFAFVLRFRIDFPNGPAEGLFLAAPESDAVDALRRSLAADLVGR